MKITSELERIGDRVVNICEAVHDRDERDRQPHMLKSGKWGRSHLRWFATA
jgi:phosphate uptake regulator